MPALGILVSYNYTYMLSFNIEICFQLNSKKLNELFNYSIILSCKFHIPKQMLHYSPGDKGTLFKFFIILCRQAKF